MAKKQEKLRPHTLRLFFALFLGAGTLLGGLSAVLYRAEIHSFMETAEERERFELELLQRVVEDVFDGIVSDLMFLAKQSLRFVHHNAVRYGRSYGLLYG